MNKNEFVLEIKDTGKIYSSVEVLKGINLQFEDKKIYGLFGRNGAGKTTLLNILSSRIFADNGLVTCYGQNILENHSVIAANCCYIPEKNCFPARLKVKGILKLGAGNFKNFRLEYADALCCIFDLNIEKEYSQLSKGHQSILRIIFSLAATTAITVLDEPVLGLDAVARDKFYTELIRDFSDNPRLFIIATHFIEEAADLFNEVIIIDQGKILKQAAVEDLLKSAFYVSGKSALVDEFLGGRQVLSSQQAGGLKTAIVEGGLANEKKVTGLNFSSLNIQKLFIHLAQDKKGQE